MQDYRALLHEEFSLRLKRNKRYSLRAFARDSKLSPPFMSDLLKKRRHLDEERAYELGLRLGWSLEKRDYFASLVRFEKLADGPLKKKLEKELRTLKAAHSSLYEIKMETYQYVCDWYHFAIAEMTYLPDFQCDARWVSSRLGLSVPVANEALQQLKALGLIEKVGEKWVKGLGPTTAQCRPSRLLREFHSQMFEKAKRSIKAQRKPDRIVSGMTMAIDPTKIEEAEARMTVFRKELMEFLETGERTMLYHLSMALFRLDKKEKNETPLH